MWVRAKHGWGAGVILVLLVGIITPAWAQGKHIYRRLEIVFLVDQSGSMGGTATRAATDPDGVRYEAVRYSLDWLGNFRAQQAMLGNPLDIRISIVYFGDTAERMPFSGQGDKANYWVSLTPKSLDDWANQRETVTQASSAAAFAKTFGKTDLGNTNFRDAFQLAIENFNLLPAGNLPAQDRLQSIVLLTDGDPCAPNRLDWYDTTCRTTSDKVTHMQNLQADIRSGFSGSNQLVYAFGIVQTDAYWDNYAGEWNSITAGRARKLSGFDQVGMNFNHVLIELVKSLLSDERNDEVQLGISVLEPASTVAGLRTVEHYISPFQERMTISLFKSKPDTFLYLVDPSGKQLQAKDVESVSGENTTLEIWQVKNPAPGTWKFGASMYDAAQSRQVSDPNASISIDLVRAQFSVEVDSVTQMYQPVTVTVYVKDTDGERVPSYSDQSFELAGTVDIVPPSGADYARQIELSRTDRGIYRVSFVPVEAGDYSFFVKSVAGLNKEVTYDQETTSTVQETKVEVQGLAETSLQNIPQHYSLHFFDTAQQEITDSLNVVQFGLIFVPRGTGTCQAPGSQAIRLVQENTTTLHNQFDKPGEYDVCLRVEIQDQTNAGNPPIVVRDNVPIGNLKIEHVTQLGLTLRGPMPTVANLEPVTKTIQDRDTKPIKVDYELSVPLLKGKRLPGWYWPSNTVSVVLQVVAATDPTQPVGIQELLPDDGAPYFKMRILDRDRDNQEIAKDVWLKPTGDPSIWSAQLPVLKAGHYTITIEAPLEKIGNSLYAFAPSMNVIQQELVVEHNVYPDVIRYGGSVLLGVFAIYLVGFRGTRNLRARIGAAQGTLVILREAGDGRLEPVSKSLNMSQRRRNRFVFGLNEFPLVDPPLTALQVISNRRLAKQKSVRVKYEINRKPATIDRLETGQHFPIYEDMEGVKYFLVKDFQPGTPSRATAENKRQSGVR